MKVSGDVVVDLQYGDCGKGKVSYDLSGRGGYTNVVRFNGGANAGHTIYHGGKNYVTHLVPAGVFHGVPCLVGSGCVVDELKLLRELEELEGLGVRAFDLVRVSSAAHLVTEGHVNEELGESRIGTTRSGIGPCYRDKYARVGKRVCDSEKLSSLGLVVDQYEYLWGGKGSRLLLEGAQGFGLDIDWGDYPYVSSSTCTVSGALGVGLPVWGVGSVFGVAKPYVTYVGSKSFGDPELDELRELGQEYGATTGRARQCNWLNVDELLKASNVNGVTHLIFNKMDILEGFGRVKMYCGGELVNFGSDMNGFMDEVEGRLYSGCDSIEDITWSRSAGSIYG